MELPPPPPPPPPAPPPRPALLLSPHIAPFHLSFLLLLLLLLPLPSLSLNITSLLSPFPDISTFSSLLSSTSVATDLSLRSSLTLLAVPNPDLLRSSSYSASASLPSDLADSLRYHVLLQYLSPADLVAIPPEGRLVTTLFQTTGRAPSNLGAVNLTRNPLTGAVVVRSPAPFSSSNATVLGLVTTLPYNVSVFSVDALLVPSGLDLTASENRPPVGVNITQALIDGKNFNVAASMLAASGVAAEFEADEKGAGITIFVPTDEAFGALPRTGERLQSLPADMKAVVLRFHVLHSYYPLGSLESIVNPVQPTLATEDTGAGRFTLNITRVNGSVAIDTGIVQAFITRTVFDQNPVAVFAVSRVLLPREIFGGEAPVEGSGRAFPATPPPMEESGRGGGLAPDGLPGEKSDPERVRSPLGLMGETRSEGWRRKGGAFGCSSLVFMCWCIGSLYLHLLV